MLPFGQCGGYAGVDGLCEALFGAAGRGDGAGAGGEGGGSFDEEVVL